MEYLRVFSCLMVILGHISNWYMREYPDLPMDSYICALLFNGICRVSVPIFFMISGALLLEQPTDFKKNLKRTSDILIKLVVWTLVFIVWDFFYLGEGYSLRAIFSVPVRVHFWFLYVLFGIYLTIPLWRKLVEGASWGLIKYFSFIFIIVTAITSFINMMKMGISYEIPLVGSSCYAGYFIMGFIIRHYINEIKIKKWICISVLIACVSATNLLTLFTSVKTGVHVELFSSFCSIFVALPAMIIFYMVMKMKEPKEQKWMHFISKHSFNVYMMHVFFLDIIQVNVDISTFSAWLGFPVFFIFLLTMSLAFSWIFEKSKGKYKSLF
ncbi:MAG: hypothetical protein E7415_04560 [Ruminococcaceae bacterium]|nr:hypothetical protein [Oscillospiraceae bacterium]